MTPKNRRPQITQKDVVEQAVTDYLQSRYQMDSDMAGLWARAMQYESGEMAKELKALVSNARADYQKTLETGEDDESVPTTLRNSEIEIKTA